MLGGRSASAAVVLVPSEMSVIDSLMIRWVDGR